MDSKNVVYKKLELLSKSKDFDVTERDEDFNVEFVEYTNDYADISAVIDKKR